MRKVLIAATAAVAFTVFQPVVYAAVQDDMKASGCFNCHEVDKKKVGPAYKEVSAKYKGKPDEAMAGMKSKPVHKAPLAKTNDAALKGMIEWVLTQ